MTARVGSPTALSPETPLTDWDGNPLVCKRHGTPLTIGEPKCWECKAEVDIQKAEREETVRVAEYKLARDERSLGLRATPVPRPVANPATEKQVAFIQSLLKERNVDALTAENVAKLTKANASKLITELLATPKPKPATPAPSTQWENVPAGRYALRVDGIVKFYRVDRPEEGRWAGYLFLSALASDDAYPVRDRSTKADLMGRIAADPAEASRLYGQEIGSCGICGRTLTDEESRAYGIGPVCRDKSGW